MESPKRRQCIATVDLHWIQLSLSDYFFIDIFLIYLLYHGIVQFNFWLKIKEKCTQVWFVCTAGWWLDLLFILNLLILNAWLEWPRNVVSQKRWVVLSINVLILNWWFSFMWLVCTCLHACIVYSHDNLFIKVASLKKIQNFSKLYFYVTQFARTSLKKAKVGNWLCLKGFGQIDLDWTEAN